MSNSSTTHTAIHPSNHSNPVAESTQPITKHHLDTNPQIISQVLTRGVTEVLPDKENLAKLMTQRPIKLYLGIDPTGSTLHLGHAVVLRKLQQFADLGHHVILLIGSGTVKIGDPTGRDASRPMLTDEQIETNFQSWQTQASKIIDFSKIEILRNGDWLDKLTFPEMVKLLAKTTIQQLMERDMFQERLKNNLPIHGHELIYPLIQGYDSVVMNVDLEIGGNDQTFNMMMGRNLQKIYNNHEKWVLTTPLINGTDGRKMSKSFNNFVGLTESPKDIYGKLMRLADEMIVEYFSILTDVPNLEIEAMETAMKSGANPMEFKKKLAFTITEWLCGTEQAEQAEAMFAQTFQQRQIPIEIPKIQVGTTEVVFQLVKKCLVNESSSNVHRLIDQGAVQLLPQEQKLTDPNQIITIKNHQVVKIGKRNFFELIP
ncbi:MAG: tyrosine--tRNA ligase [Patescibacteria group bacterium]